MARADALGLFWEDRPVEKVLKEKAPKRTPPERTWERPDYLPGLDEALAFNVDLFTDLELGAVAGLHRMVYDIECYPNYFLIAFKSIVNKKVVYFEQTLDSTFNREKLLWVLHNFCHIGFNSISYDAPIAALASAGKSCAILHQATCEIIQENVRSQDILRKHKVKKLDFNHIDLIEVAPLFASLKIYGGRLHIHKMQDLPFPPGTVLSPEQIAITRLYCINDLHATETLYLDLEPEIQLRESMSKEYGVDLRSKSDAQIAEAVIVHEVTSYNGRRPTRPEIAPGTRYHYKVPKFIKFETYDLQWVLEQIRTADFIVSEFGNITKPPALEALHIPIGGSVYRMGIGGLHSSEKCRSIRADSKFTLIDIDVSSNYPIIILNLGLFPPQLGTSFLTVYRSIVKRRLTAKAAKDKLTANMLKIVVNGSFGKFGSMYSMLYAPDFLIQTTLTGQLCLLMLIERLELRGVSVLSANTDGIVVRCPRDREQEVQAIFTQWRKDTNFETEETIYAGIYSRDVNNYIAVKEDGGVKSKGAYSETGLHKNPTNEICANAVRAFLLQGTPIATTIQSSTDIRQFVSVRTVKGGAVKDGEYLGKAIRWYYAQGMEGEIVYAKSGNKVPRSDGAKPLMVLPDEFPCDVDHEWYIKEAQDMLNEIGYYGHVELEAKEGEDEE